MTTTCPTCEALDRWLARTVMLDQTSHDTPKREWVGLTDEDKWEIKKAVTYNQFETAGEYANRVQAVTEAKLKEKNSGHT